MRKLILLLFLICLTKGNANAQIIDQITRLYWQNYYRYNSAAVGLNEKRSICAGLSYSYYGSGSDWINYVHPLKSGKNILGINAGEILIQGSLFGPEGKYNIYNRWVGASYSRKIILPDSATITFGSTMKYIQNDYDDIEDHGPYNSYVPENYNISYLTGDYGIFYTNKNLYTGLSINNIIRKNIKLAKPTDNLQSYIYFIVGYLITLEKDVIKMEPKLILRHAAKSRNTIFNINNSFVFKDRFTIGASFQKGGEGGNDINSIIFNSSITIRKKFTIGFAADVYNTYRSNNHSSGEGILIYSF